LRVRQHGPHRCAVTARKHSVADRFEMCSSRGGMESRRASEGSAARDLAVSEPAAQDVGNGAASSRRESPARSELSASTFAVLCCLFSVSGGLGLIDQVCFSKYLSTVFGATAYAISAVLAAFMCGLMLGSHFGGKLAGRVRRPLLAYGVAELCAAVSIALAPVAFQALTPAYVELAVRFEGSLVLVTGLRWLFAALVVVIPTTAMGMTLPLLAPALRSAGSGESNSRLNALYAANTFGGALGALLAAYTLLPTLGLSGTLQLAAGLTGLIGVAASIAGLRIHAVSSTAHEVEEPPAVSLRRELRPREQVHAVHADGSTTKARLQWVAALSGAVVFVAEVVNTHLLAVVVGNSVYAFSVILAVFLLCLFAGAAFAPNVERRFGSHALSISLSLSGCATLAVLPVWDLLPPIFGAAGHVVNGFWGREVVRATVAAAILVVPTVLMGLTFPLVLRSIAQRADVGAWVGSLTVSNTLGAIFGSLLAGYVLLPSFGSELSLRGVALVLAGAGALLAAGDGLRQRASFQRLVLFALAGAAVLLPRWDLARLTAGSNVYFSGYTPPRQVPFVREDVHGGITTITEADNGVHTLLTNGKFQGNDGLEMHAQRFFAHYPSLFVSDFARALVIGLGTGTTLGTYAGYPWRQIDVVEISPAIVEAASDYFTSVNHGALDDPRLTLHINDGRNHLLTSTARYDLIGMELSSVWFAGAAALYSRDFYELVGERLTEGGIFQQWVQLHHMHDDVFATVLHTLRQQFEHVALFYGGGQGILVASHRPLRASVQALRVLQGRSELADLLPADRSLASLLADVLVTERGIDAFIRQAADESERAVSDLVSTDDNLRLEYDTPKGNVMPWSSRENLVSRLASHREAEHVDALLVP